MKFRSPSTFAALLLLLVVSPAIFQGLDNLKRDVQHHMQATLWGVLLKFNGHGASDPAIPADGRIRRGDNAPAICSDAPATKRQRKAEPDARPMTARRKSSPAPNNTSIDPVNEFSELAAGADAVAGAETVAQPLVAAVWPAVGVAPEADPELEVADAVAVIAAPRPAALPQLVTEAAASLRNLELKTISYDLAAHKQARVVLKHAAEWERAARRNWRPQMLIKSQLRVLDSVKAKPCREAERKESETKAERREPRQFIFTDDSQSFVTTTSEE